MALSGEFEMATSGEQVTAITGLLAPMRGEFASIISGYLIQEYALCFKPIKYRQLFASRYS